MALLAVRGSVLCELCVCWYVYYSDTRLLTPIPLSPVKLNSIELMVLLLTVTKKSNVPVQISIDTTNPPIPIWVLGTRRAIFGGIGRALSHFGAMGVRTPAIGET